MAFDLAGALTTAIAPVAGYGAGVQAQQKHAMELQRMALQKALAERQLANAERELQFREMQEDRLRDELDLRREQEERFREQFEEEHGLRERTMDYRVTQDQVEQQQLEDEASTWARILPPQLLEQLGPNPSMDAVARLGRSYAQQYLRDTFGAPEAGLEEIEEVDPATLTYDDLPPDDQERIDSLISDIGRGKVNFADPRVRAIKEQMPLLWREFIVRAKQATEEQAQKAGKKSAEWQAREKYRVPRQQGTTPRRVP